MILVHLLKVYHTPQAIITDQDRAMKNAIEAVFPKGCYTPFSQNVK